jgi:hypothetical protein
MSGNLKRTLRLAVATVAAVAGLALAAPAGQAVERPFHLDEEGTVVFDGPNATSVGIGTATHLGRFTLYRSGTFYDPVGSVLQFDGRATLVAANGDELYSSIEGTLDSATGTGRLTYEWTGGSGRFEHATGTTTWRVVVNPDLTFSAVADGVIDY